MNHKPVEYPKTRKQLAEQIAWVAEHMMDIGTSLEVLAGFDARMAAQGRLLVAAGQTFADVAAEVWQ